MNKVNILITLLLLSGIVACQNMEKCYQAALQFKNSYVHSLERRDVELIIDDLEQVFEAYPTLLDTCGAEDKASEVRSDYPPACSKVLAKEAKLLVKILRLNA